MSKTNITEAQKHLAKIREIVAKNPPAIFRMSKEDVVRIMRRTRESIWEEKLAVRH